MKKVLLGMFIAVVSICMVSCQSGGGIDKAKEIIKELKEKGASMDKAALKEKVLSMFEAIKPVAEKVKKAFSEAEKDPAKAMEVIQSKDVQDLMSLSEEMKGLDEIPAMKELENDPDIKKAAEVFNEL